MYIMTGHNWELGPWMCERQGCAWMGVGETIGLMDADNSPLAVACFDNYNKVNINVHLAAVSGKRWLNREFLWYCFYYPFVQLGVKRITGIAASSNTEVRKFMLNIGFTLEATLKDAHPDGDLLVYCMTKDNCRWLTLKDSPNELVQRRRTTPT